MADELSASRARRPDPLSLLWRIFCAPQALMVLLGLVALALAVGSLIPQIPSLARSDPLAWLANLSGLLGRLGSFLWAARLVDLAHAPWFHLLLALTGVALLVRMADLLELSWRAVGRSRWTAASFRYWDGHAPPQSLSPFLSLDQAGARLRPHLAAHGYRTRQVPDLPLPTLVASRRAWALWAGPLAYAGLLAALAGLFVLGTWGWETEEWQPYPGETRLVGHNTPYALRLDTFDQAPAGTPQPATPASRVSWLQGTELVRTGTARLGHAATLHGLALRQMGYVPTLQVRGWDEAGRPLVLQTESEQVGIPAVAGIAFPTAESQPLLFVPRHDFFLAFRFEPACGAARPGVAVDRLQADGSGRRTLQVLDQSGTVVADGLRLEVELAYLPILRLDYRPGMTLVVVGLAFALAALGLGWILSPRLIWLTLGPEQEGVTRLLAIARPGTAGTRWLRRCVEALREELRDGA
jgi:hypothetical protein